MQKDQQLKKQTATFVILVCGNHQVGKKTFVSNYLKSINIDASAIVQNKSYYTFYAFNFNFNNDITIPVEIRILNSDEMDTDLKMIKPYFQGAMAAFIITRLDDYATFEEGKKWKEKVDLMCCLPNKFPLPILLIINMCDKIAIENQPKWKLDLQIDKFYTENQFFEIRYISSVDANADEEISIISNKSSNAKDLSIPFTIVYDFVLGFNDIQSLFNENSSINGNANEEVKSKSSSSICIIV